MLLVPTLAIAAAIFLSGSFFRVMRTLRVPRPLRWELYPIPKGPRERQRYGGSYFEETDWWTKQAESSHTGELAFMAQEVLLLHSVRKNFRELWLWSWLLHWGLYLYIAAALLMAASWLLSSGMLLRLAIYTCGLACISGCLGSLGLLFLRTTLLRLRPYTTRAAKFNLLFLAVFFVTGGLSLAGIARQFAQGLNFAALISDASPVLRLHLMLLAFFLVYFPFTHMTHAYMKFFTWHGVRWDDVPAAHVSSTNTVLAGSLGRHVTWSAPHIAGEGETWSQAVADAEGRGAGRHA